VVVKGLDTCCESDSVKNSNALPKWELINTMVPQRLMRLSIA